MSRAATRACVLLFARDPAAEETAKGLAGGRCLFDFTRRRIIKAVAGLAGVDLIVAGSGAGDLLQRGAGFGERLLNAFQDARALGFDRIVAVPIDTPQIDRCHLREALLRLGTHEVVLGRSPDGGVYLIGARGDVAGLFEGVRWRSSSVGADLIANAPDAVLLAEELADVDGRADIVSLRSSVAQDPELSTILGWLLSAPATHSPGSDEVPDTGPASRLPISRAPPFSPSPY